MRAIISSKHLAEILSKIDFSNDEYVEGVYTENDTLHICTNRQVIPVGSEIIMNFQDDKKVEQENRRWDWVKKLVNQVDEQPIVLHIARNVVQVAFQY